MFKNVPYLKSISGLVSAVLLCVVYVSCGQGTAGNHLFSGSPTHIVLKDIDELKRFLTYDEQRFPLISAHRGGPQEGYPENAIQTFEFQQKKQPLIIEADIQMTKDSVLILMHDETLNRTTNGKGRIRDRTYAEISDLRLMDPNGNLTEFKVPTLDAALQWGNGKTVFTLDVKRGVPYHLVVDALHRNRAEAYSIVITYNADQAMQVYNLDPNLMISASIRSESDLLRLNDRNIPDNRLVAFVGTSEVDPGVYELLHSHGIMCILGTMGNLDRQAEKVGKQHYIDLINRGADILSTDRPIEAGEALRSYRNKSRLVSDFVQ